MTINKALIAACGCLALIGPAALGQAPVGQAAQPPSAGVAVAPVKLWRLDCGGGMINLLNVFSDTRAYSGQSKAGSAGCYLIKHGAVYMLWDSGLPLSFKGVPVNRTDPMSFTLDKTLVEQLATLHVRPEQISIVGISHYHSDHVGQAGFFPGATLMIGKADLDALRTTPPPAESDLPPLAHWLNGPGKIDAVSGDRDIFGDGTVTMIDLPGHTPGHHGLLVRLSGMGYVLLTGDAVHFRENYDTDGVPEGNTSRAETLASIERIKGLAKNLNATVIIQHDQRDIAKLPAFPAAAE